MLYILEFSLIDEQFNIYVNGELINEDMLKDLADDTQFLWKINDIVDPFLEKLSLESEARKIIIYNENKRICCICEKTIWS